MNVVNKKPQQNFFKVRGDIIFKYYFMILNNFNISGYILTPFGLRKFFILASRTLNTLFSSLKK